MKPNPLSVNRLMVPFIVVPSKSAARPIPREPSVHWFPDGFGGIRAAKNLPLGQLLLRGHRNFLRGRNARCASTLQLSGSKSAEHRKLEAAHVFWTFHHGSSDIPVLSQQGGET